MAIWIIIRATPGERRPQTRTSSRSSATAQGRRPHPSAKRLKHFLANSINLNLFQLFDQI
jgi:hypothetical protein